MQPDADQGRPESWRHLALRVTQEKSQSSAVPIPKHILVFTFRTLLPGDTSFTPVTSKIEIPTVLAEVLLEALAHWASRNGLNIGVPVPKAPEPKTVLRRILMAPFRRSVDHTTRAELGTDGVIHVNTGFSNGIMQMDPTEAIPFVNALRVLIDMAMGSDAANVLRPRNGCVHCEQERAHDRHESAAEVAERVRVISEALRAQSGRTPPDS